MARNATARVVLLDFSKAFDLIDYSVLAQKLTTKTKLGPWLFLVMIHDLDTPADMWKYMDVTSCSEIVTKGSRVNSKKLWMTFQDKRVSMGSN